MRRIINMRALLVIALGFIFGILFGKFNIVYGLEIFIIFPAALLIVTLAFSLIFKKEKAYVAGLSLVSLMLCVCFVCGYILFDSAAVRYEKAAIEENRYTVAGRVESFREYDNYLSVTLDGVSFTDGDHVIESDYKIRVYAYYDDVYEFDIGSLVTFSAKVKNYSSFYKAISVIIWFWIKLNTVVM